MIPAAKKADKIAKTQLKLDGLSHSAIAQPRRSPWLRSEPHLRAC
jgi:hypothetical protein